MSVKRTVYIGCTGVNMVAYRVCVESLLRHACCNVTIKPLLLWRLQMDGLYTRPFVTLANGQRIDLVDGNKFSTEFSFSRFWIPLLEDFRDEEVLFVDSDVMFRADVDDIFDEAYGEYAVRCVQHDFTPSITKKITGLAQEPYWRKNWSSVMVINPAMCIGLDFETINTASGNFLHTFGWLPNEKIGKLDPSWNVLFGEQENDDAKLVHFTNGTPDVRHYKDRHKYVREWERYAESMPAAGY